MSKVGGTYPQIIFGVSEQVPQNRRPGQVTEQDNMLSDPVRGLCRRRGSVWQDEITVGSHADALAEAQKMREFTFVIEGNEYTLLYRRLASALNKDKFMYLYDKTGGQFIPIVYENSTWVNDLISGGASALACVGRYVYIAGNTTIPSATTTDVWTTATNKQKLAAWIRAGAFSRKYTLTLTKTDLTKVEVFYETKPAAYPELLDTSDIEFWADPPTNSIPREDYQKDVNDRVNEYNGLVNAWIKESAEDIAPANIAEKLKDELVLLGIAAGSIEGTVYVDDADFIDIRISDGGDNTMAVAVGQEVSDPTRVTRHHWVGKIVRVRPTGGTDRESYYLEARSDEGETGWAAVTWYETAGVTHEVDNFVSQLVIHEGTAYVAQDGAGLLTLAPTSGPHPAYKGNLVGDGVTAPLPYYFGRTITMLSVFQDRLIVGSGGTINASRNGDYLNFFRATVLSVLDNDPVEAYAYGSEGDTLRHAVDYDKSLIVFGDKKQYAIIGTTLFTPKAPLVAKISAHDGATAAAPVASGNFVFYGKSAEGRTSLHQMFPGQLLQSPVSSEVSQQLDTYLEGSPVQLTCTTTPNLIMYRTEDQPSTFYVYRYLDDDRGQQRLMDAWHKWSYSPTLGTISGLSVYNGDVLVFTMRVVGGTTYVVADKCSTNAELDVNPYLDSWRPLADLDGWHTAASDDLSAAVRKPSEFFLLGTPMTQLTEFLEQLPEAEDYLNVGAVSPGKVTPTNPFVRDSNGQAVMTGRLTFTQAQISVEDSGGMSAQVFTKQNSIFTLVFEGRVLGNSANIIANQPIYTGELVVGIGREVRSVEYTLHTEDWQPLTITGIGWTGQHFNRVRRVS